MRGEEADGFPPETDPEPPEDTSGWDVDF